MTNAPTIFRSLIIYTVCVVLAVWLGFLLAGPLTYSSLFLYGILAFILVFPILLRWHYPLLLLSWNFAAVAFLLPGRPSVALVMIMLSLFISLLQRMINNQSRFIRVPQINIPLYFTIAVIVFTARMTGVGLHVFGSDIYGGKKYVYLIIGILGYFALTAHRIPPERKNLYLGLFFLGGLTSAIGDLVSFLPHPFYFIYLFFNVNTYYFVLPGQGGIGTTRFSGAVGASLAIFFYMLARYGLRGIFLSGKPMRWIIFVLAMLYGFLGGFRGLLLDFAIFFTLQFFLEGLHRTKLLPILFLAGFFGAVALIPLSSHLPYTFQRVLSFLPYKVSTAARLDAQSTLDWHIRLWKEVLPEVPKYLLLGKGYVVSQLNYDFVQGANASVRSSTEGWITAGDFHNGPLSVVIPFGIWGCIAFLWFIIVGIRVTYHNYRYGDPALQTANTFLLAAFAGQAISFVLVYGAFSDDMLKFCGLLGLSVALNGGVRRPVRVIRHAREMDKPHGLVQMPSPAPAFHRHR